MALTKNDLAAALFDEVGLNKREEIPISARRVVTFKPGQKLRNRVETYVGSGD